MSKKDIQMGKVAVGVVVAHGINIRLFKQSNGYQVKNMDSEATVNYPTLESVFMAHSDMQYCALKGKLKKTDGSIVDVAYRYTGINTILYIEQAIGYAHAITGNNQLYYAPLLQAKDIPRSHQLFSNNTAG